ncbi:hypothetical protein ACFY2J_27675 [Streptomyces collinus]|uniref:hypothetical protein n=1 Tax=Streptomyces collinus TaxID=42684 RepID=UPI0036B4C4EE
MSSSKRSASAAPAVAMTAVSMVLTLAVVVMWLGGSMPWGVALVVGLGLDGGWLATLAYERRLARQGDHNNAVTAVGWSFGVVATGVLVAHALTAGGNIGAWLAVSWLPLGAKALWLVHGLWEQTALTAGALESIRTIQQQARDAAALERARLRAEAGTEQTRLAAVTAAGARVARVRAATATKLAKAWSQLEGTQQGEGAARALAGTADGWALPAWTTPPTPAATITAGGTNVEESAVTGVERSRAGLPESTLTTVTLTRLPLPDPVPAVVGKSGLLLKPVPALAAPIESAPTRPTARRPVAAESTRPTRATYRVPETAKTPRVRRTPEQLMTEARTLTVDWPDAQITGEGIRRELRTSPANARKLRDALLAERAG